MPRQAIMSHIRFCFTVILILDYLSLLDGSGLAPSRSSGIPSKSGYIPKPWGLFTEENSFSLQCSNFFQRANLLSFSTSQTRILHKSTRNCLPGDPKRSFQTRSGFPNLTLKSHIYCSLNLTKNLNVKSGHATFAF